MDNPIRTNRRTGTISRYYPKRLYGFINPDCGGVRVFFHLNNCQEHNTFLELGENIINLRVSYLPCLREANFNNKSSLQLAAKDVELSKGAEVSKKYSKNEGELK